MTNTLKKLMPTPIFNVTFNFAIGSSINNIKFAYPKAPFYHSDSQIGITPCPVHHSEVPTEGTRCTQVSGRLYSR